MVVNSLEITASSKHPELEIKVSSNGWGWIFQSRLSTQQLASAALELSTEETFMGFGFSLQDTPTAFSLHSFEMRRKTPGMLEELFVVLGGAESITTVI